MLRHTGFYGATVFICILVGFDAWLVDKLQMQALQAVYFEFFG